MSDHVKTLLEDPEKKNDVQEIWNQLPQTRGRFFTDRRKDVKDALEYLTFLANQLPEKQRQKTFTAEQLAPFFTGIFQKPAKMNQREEELRKKRLIRICCFLIGQLRNPTLAYELAPGQYEIFSEEDKTYAGIKAIYHQGIAEDQKTSREEKEKKKQAEQHQNKQKTHMGA